VSHFSAAPNVGKFYHFNALRYPEDSKDSALDTDQCGKLEAIKNGVCSSCYSQI